MLEKNQEKTNTTYEEYFDILYYLGVPVLTTEKNACEFSFPSQICRNSDVLLQGYQQFKNRTVEVNFKRGIMIIYKENTNQEIDMTVNLFKVKDFVIQLAKINKDKQESW